MDELTCASHAELFTRQLGTAVPQPAAVRLTVLLAPLQLLAKNFAAMQHLGDPVLKPFLQVSRPPRGAQLMCSAC